MSAAHARAYLGKADEYLAAAMSELEAGRAIAATSLAIHAGINATDAVTGIRVSEANPANVRSEVPETGS